MRVRLLATIACLALLASPAWAQPEGDVEATIIVTGGPLSITAPDAVNLGSAFPGGTTTDQLGLVSVTDQRGQVDATWVATVSATNFTSQVPVAVVPAGALEYWSGPAVQTVGEGSFVPGQLDSSQAVPLDQARVAFQKTGGDGGNLARWTASVRLHVPDDAVGATYTGTVTHSVA